LIYFQGKSGVGERHVGIVSATSKGKTIRLGKKRKEERKRRKKERKKEKKKKKSQR
jgi:hypothetical protein